MHIFLRCSKCIIVLIKISFGMKIAFTILLVLNTFQKCSLSDNLKTVKIHRQKQSELLQIVKRVIKRVLLINYLCRIILPLIGKIWKIFNRGMAPTVNISLSHPSKRWTAEDLYTFALNNKIKLISISQC